MQLLPRPIANAAFCAALLRRFLEHTAYRPRRTVYVSLNDSNFLTRMLYKNINRFDDINLLTLAFIFHIDCLVAVCQPLIKLLLTYLLTDEQINR